MQVYYILGRTMVTIEGAVFLYFLNQQSCVFLLLLGLGNFKKQNFKLHKIYNFYHKFEAFLKTKITNTYMHTFKLISYMRLQTADVLYLFW